MFTQEQTEDLRESQNLTIPGRRLRVVNSYLYSSLSCYLYCCVAGQ